MKYLKIENEIIVGIGSSVALPKGAIALPKGKKIEIGRNINCYDKDFNLRPLRELVKKRLVEIPPCHKLNDNGTEFIAKTEFECYRDGDKELPLYCVAEDNEQGYRLKRDDELDPVKDKEEIARRSMNDLKAKLANTDYVAIKIAEDETLREKYADILAQRQAWREKIKEFETALDKIQ